MGDLVRWVQTLKDLLNTSQMKEFSLENAKAIGDEEANKIVVNIARSQGFKPRPIWMVPLSRDKLKNQILKTRSPSEHWVLADLSFKDGLLEFQCSFCQSKPFWCITRESAHVSETS